MYPVPYASIEGRGLELAVMAEELGFESVWGNDHIASQRYVPGPVSTTRPTTTIRSGNLGLRQCQDRSHPPGHLRDRAAVPPPGRRRQANWPPSITSAAGGWSSAWASAPTARSSRRSSLAFALHRGPLRRGGDPQPAAAVSRRRRASFDGEYIRFADVESYPKPRQPVLPILSGGKLGLARRTGPPASARDGSPPASRQKSSTAGNQRDPQDSR